MLKSIAILIITISGLNAGSIETYRGFSIDGSSLTSDSALDAIFVATKSQIDIVCSVGLAEDMITFFQTVPIEIVARNALSGGTPGAYGKDKKVKIVASIVNIGKKPVLLHEFFHAYHDQKIKDGFLNEEIVGYFKKAKSIDGYNAGSHMMANEKEFFACTATTYLYGATAQEPFKRLKIQQNQPIYFKYLEKLFGASCGHYEGVLN